MTATRPTEARRAFSPGRGLSLRAQLMLGAVLLVLVPGGIYGVISFSSSRDALAAAGGRLLMQEARGAADRLASSLRTERARLETLAAQDVMREIRISDLDKRISALLVSAKRNCASCRDLSIRDISGRVVASSNPALIGGEPSGPVPDGDGFSGPHPAGAQAALKVVVTIPDPDGDGELGKLVAWHDWYGILNVLGRVRENLFRAGVQSAVLVTDSQDVLIGAALPRDAQWKVGQALEPLPAGRSPTGFVDADAGQLVGYAALPEGLPPWTLRVAQPLAQAYAPAHATAMWLLLALALVLAVALVIALVAAGRLSRPLTALADAAAAVGRGERPIAPIPVRSGGEVRTLTEAFNDMASDLARVEHDLTEAAKFSFVGELAAGVAHEVRTPLGVMRSSAQMLARADDVNAAESQELLQLLQSEVDRVDRVVSALLDLGRPRQMHAEPTLLGPLLARVARFVEAQAAQKQVRIEVGATEPYPAVRGDSELLYQAMLNLAVNAIQMLDEGGTLRLSLLRIEGHQGGFEVRDNGPGLNEDTRQRLFEPFFTRRQGGTGLGLTLVQRVVHEHRGRIEVDGKPGEGTVFRVRIPLYQAPHRENA